MIGDRTNRILDSQQSALAAKWVPFVYRWAGRQSRGDRGKFRSLLGIGHDALVRCAGRFEPERGLSFGTLLAWDLRSALDNRVRYDNTQGRDPSRVVRVDHMHAIEDQSAPPPISGAIHAERREAVELAIAKAELDERREYVIRRTFWGGAFLHEIADELGVSKERCRQLKEDALTKIAKRSGLATLARHVDNNQ